MSIIRTHRLVAVAAAAVLTLGVLALPAAAQPSNWTIVTTANTSPNQDNVLLGVSCPSTDFCVSVGHHQNDQAIDQTLIEAFDGSTWSIVPSPNTSDSLTNDLADVSCASASFCVAVGNAKSTTGYLQSLVEVFDGSRWTIMSSPNTSPTVPQYLNGVDCLSSTFCVSVGATEDEPGVTQTLALTYNGTAWTITPTPNNNTSSLEVNILGTVSCPSPTSCIAVGDYFAPNGHSQSLVESFNGAAWTISPSPNSAADENNILYGVSCPTAGACEAVGTYSDAAFVSHTLAMSYNGTNWAITPSPNTAPDVNNQLQSVDCSSPISCTAVGFTSQPAPHPETLVETFSGSTWSLVPSPNTSPDEDNTLYTVTCATPENCVAVGSWQAAGDPQQTLALERFAPPAPNSGYWEVGSDGGIFAFGGAGFFGSMGGHRLNAPVVGMAATTDRHGYWEVASDGGIFAFGDAGYYGSMGGRRLNQPVVGMAPTADGHGYWLVARDGGIFAFGDADYFGSMGGQPLNKPVVGMAADPATGGYWLVASDGGIFSFRTPFFGSTGALVLNAPIVGMAAALDGSGYWLVGGDGGVFAFANAYYGSEGGQMLSNPMVAIAAAPGGAGYWLVDQGGRIFAFGDAPDFGSMAGQMLNAPMVAMASAQ